MIIGIDPGATKPHTLALYTHGKIQSIRKFDSITKINDIICDTEEVFIESQYLGRNPNTLIKLAHATGELIGLCKLHGIPYHMVYPTTWMAHFGIMTRKPKELSPYKWKKKHYQDIIDEAQKHTDIKIEDEDYAASLLICLFGINKLDNS